MINFGSSTATLIKYSTITDTLELSTIADGQANHDTYYNAANDAMHNNIPPVE